MFLLRNNFFTLILPRRLVRGGSGGPLGRPDIWLPRPRRSCTDTPGHNIITICYVSFNSNKRETKKKKKEKRKKQERKKDRERKERKAGKSNKILNLKEKMESKLVIEKKLQTC